MTFSIVARDGESGQAGVAIATARPCVGAWSAFVRPGVGACATQAIVNPGLGAACLHAMAGGADAVRALGAVLDQDAEPPHRQVVAIGLAGAPAAHTGVAVTPWAGHLVGEDFAVAGNIVVGEEVITAMAQAYTEASGDLADRLLVALAAGDAAGGDRRGRESAALVVADRRDWAAVDLRVDHAADPIGELRRLRVLWRRHWEHYDTTGQFVPADPPGSPGVRERART